MKKRLAIVFTGGTISMKYDPAIGGAVPALSGREILDLVQGVDEVADAEVIEFGRYPGPHMTLPRMMELSSVVRATLEREDVVGVAVTHGTHVGALRNYATAGQQTWFKWRTGTGASAATANVTADGELNRFAPQAYYYAGPFGVFTEYGLTEEGFQKGALRRDIAQ